MDRKIFWYEALKGGTMIGLVRAAFALLQQALLQADKTGLASVVGILSFATMVFMIYALTRRVSAWAPAEQGFSYGKGMSFVFAMMLFTGVVMGLYQAIMNNFVMPDLVYEQVSEMMPIYESVLQADQVDLFYDSMVRSMMSPFTLVFSSIFASLLTGGFIALIVCAITVRRPDIFAQTSSSSEVKSEENNESGSNE